MLTEGAIPVDVFAKRISELSAGEMEELHRMSAKADWRAVTGRGYDTADVTGFWEPHKRAFFIRIPPRGSIPKHHDVFIEGITHHFVVKTNPKCGNGWIDTEGHERKMHLKSGHRYSVERTPLHWAWNHGNSDRIHLLVEF